MLETASSDVCRSAEGRIHYCRKQDSYPVLSVLYLHLFHSLRTFIQYITWNTQTVVLWSWASYQIREIPGCACAGMPETFSPPPTKRKTLVSDPSIHHGTCGAHVPRCMSGSLTSCCGEYVPGIFGARATRNFTYLERGPLRKPFFMWCQVWSTEQWRTWGKLTLPNYDKEHINTDRAHRSLVELGLFSHQTSNLWHG